MPPGCRDYAPYLATSSALALWRALGPARVRAYCRALVREAADLLAAAWGAAGGGGLLGPGVLPEGGGRGGEAGGERGQGEEVEEAEQGEREAEADGMAAFMVLVELPKVGGGIGVKWGLVVLQYCGPSIVNGLLCCCASKLWAYATVRCAV